MAETVETTFYVQLEPEFWTLAGEQRVRGIKARSLTQSRPAKAAHPVVKLTLRMPKAAFMPLAPVVTIEVPESAIDFTPTITVELPDA